MKEAMVGTVCLALMAAVAQAAFIVEPHSSGKAYGNFAYQDGTTPSYTSTLSAAVGLTATSTAYGGNGTIDSYIFSYTPGVDVDNTPLTAGNALGTHRLDPAATLVPEDQVASGLVGGESGTYKVFITWPKSGNVNTAGSKITITSDGADIVLDPVSQNGDPAYPATYTDIGNAGMDKWLCIGTVELTGGNTYSVTQLANVASFVSQRNAGVMWERVPEPASLTLLGIGLLFLRRRR